MYTLKTHQIQHNPFDHWLQWEVAAACIGISFLDVPKQVGSSK